MLSSMPRIAPAYHTESGCAAGWNQDIDCTAVGQAPNKPWPKPVIRRSPASIR